MNLKAISPFADVGIFSALIIGMAGMVVAVGILALTPWPWMAPVAVVFLSLPLVMVRYPEPFFLCIVFLIPMTGWRGLSEHIPALSVSKILGIPLFVAVALRIILHREEGLVLVTRRWIIPLLIAVVWLIAVLQSPWRVEAADNFRQLLQAFSFMALSAWTVGNAERLRRLTLTIAYSSAVSATVAVTGFFLKIPWLMVHGSTTQGVAQRAVGTGDDPNIFAAAVLFALPCSFAWALRTRRMARLGWIVIIGLQCTAVVLTYSRSITLMLLGALVLLGFEHRKKLNARHLPLMILLVIAMLAGMIVLTKGTTIRHLASLSQSSSDPSLMRRSGYIGVALSAVVQRPVIGWGPGVFDQLWARTPMAAAFANTSADFYRRAHNTFLEIVVGSGIIGLALFVGSCILALCRLLGNRAVEDHALRRSIGLGFIILMTSLLTLSDAYNKYLWLSMGVGLAGLPLVQRREVRS